jgi:uncharacterized membrane protein
MTRRYSMIPQPLHPAVVHFPIVFVVLFPLAAIAAWIAIRRGTETRRAWLPVVALAVALAGSAWIATQTGEREEDVAEAVVPESAIHAHEEAAELFLSMSVVTLLLTAAGLLGGGVGRVARPAATVCALALVVAGYRVGHSGGALVYEHGAGQAYAAPAYGPGLTPGVAGERHDSERERHD